MKNAHDLISAIGSKTIQHMFNIGPTAVSNAATKGALPASWFFALRKHCAARGIECPESLFAFREAAND